MNTRKQQAIQHQKELIASKQALMGAINKELSHNAQLGYNTEITPQLQRLLQLDSYRARDVDKIQKLLDSPQRLQEYLFVVDPSTAEIISGAKALENYEEWKNSPIYRPSKQAEVVVQNFQEQVARAFVDMTAYNQFVDVLSSLASGSVNTVDMGLFSAVHPGLRKPSRSNMRYFLQQNHGNMNEIAGAMDRLIESDGIEEVARRIESEPDLLEQLTVAAIGYYNDAAVALQSVLRVFLPSATARQASAMQDIYESQFYEEME